MSGNGLLHGHCRLVTALALHVVLESYYVARAQSNVTGADVSSVLEVHRKTDHGAINWGPSPPLQHGNVTFKKLFCYCFLVSYWRWLLSYATSEPLDPHISTSHGSV